VGNSWDNWEIERRRSQWKLSVSRRDSTARNGIEDVGGSCSVWVLVLFSLDKDDDDDDDSGNNR